MQQQTGMRADTPPVPTHTSTFLLRIFAFSLGVDRFTVDAATACLCSGRKAFVAAPVNVPPFISRDTGLKVVHTGELEMMRTPFELNIKDPFQSAIGIAQPH